ncbi:rhomboid family GlyGly-CTERM serine protease [Neorhodopirellula lusitana]|uniref:Rhomboid family GlyGly-CTERM serine protease n=1 Tax=Neorhodopirellula lusitana TaxID=445327 RepID=A0ABY1Q685_9BACT|nr:rhombosortase [Neorhodopirellula lusitana]SMP59057.1 rhomboid family GlyGly-CTERM serine protease [Neorhodopirellula lusitana]
MSTGESFLTTLPPIGRKSFQSMCRPGSVWLRQAPVTWLASAVAIAAFAFPSLTAALQLDFAAVDAGQWWRLLSGHLTHFGGDHLFWDLLMFIVLGAACERQHPWLYPIALTAMALGISATIALTCQDVTNYRGLSGIDTGLFVWFIATQIRQSLADRDRTFTTFWTAAGVLLTAKLLYESTTGEILFVNAEGFIPLVESHLSGAVFGAIFAGVGFVLDAWPRQERR